MNTLLFYKLPQILHSSFEQTPHIFLHSHIQRVFLNVGLSNWNRFPLPTSPNNVAPNLLCDQNNIEEVSSKLMTVCCTFLENPFIRFHEKSLLSKEIGLNVQAKIDSMVKKAGKSFTPHDPKGTLLIIDRTFDLNSPIMHDIKYEVMVYDFFNIRKDGAVDPDDLLKSWDESSEAEPKKKGKYIFLAENNKFWNECKNMHIGEVIEKLIEDTKELAKTNSEISKVYDKNQDIANLQDIVSKMPNFKEIVANFKGHEKMSRSCSEAVKSNNLMNLIKLEQGIINGVETDGKDMDIRKITTAIGRLFSDFPTIKENEENILRMYMLYLANYDVPKRDIETLSKSFTKPKYKEALQKFVQLLGGRLSTKFKSTQRREPKAKKEDFELFKQRSSSSKFADLLYLPKVGQILLEASHNTLPTSEFPFAGMESAPSPSRAKKTAFSMFGESKAESSLEASARLIVFVIGGISHQELTAIFKMQQGKLIPNPITIGGDNVITPSNFIDSLLQILVWWDVHNKLKVISTN